MTHSFTTIVTHRRLSAVLASLVAASITLAAIAQAPQTPPEPPAAEPNGVPVPKPAATSSPGILSRHNQAGTSAKDLTASKPSLAPTQEAADPKLTTAGADLQAASGPAPIVFDPPLLNLGEMQADIPKTGVLKIRNVGDKPVTIARAIPGCGCTTANAPKDPIAPGGFAEMEITLKPGPKQGVTLSKRVTFQIDGYAPMILTVEGQVVEYIKVTPDAIEGPDKPETAKADSGKIVLSSVDKQPFKITAVNPPVVQDISDTASLEHILQVDWQKWQDQGRPIKLTIATDHPKAAALGVMVKRPISATDRPTPIEPTQRATTQPASDLVVAAQQGNTARVKELLAAPGVNVNETDPGSGRTALHWAARENRTEIIDLLLAAKADANSPDRTGKGPLTLAAETGSIDAEKLLLAKGASVTNRDTIGGTALIWACGLGTGESVRVLLDAGADANITDVNGLTPLIWAAGIGKPESVAILLERNPNLPLEVKDGVTGDTALMRAVRSGKIESVRMLINRKADVNTVNKQGYSPVQLAAMSGTAEKVKLLIEAKADLGAKDATGRTALDLAQRRTDAAGREIAELLKANGATSAVPVPAQGGSSDSGKPAGQ
jgi:ankyrin repeat protein